MNTCDPNAICQDTDESYVCSCKTGYIDQSPDPVNKPGQKCFVSLSFTVAPTLVTRPTGIPLIACNRSTCDPGLGEMCIGGSFCGCPPNQARRNSKDKCQPASFVDFPIILARRNEVPLFWTESFGDAHSPRFLEIAEIFNKGMGSVYQSTNFGPYFLTSEVREILNPRNVNNSLNTGGLYTNYRVYYSPEIQTAVKNPEEIQDTIIRTIVNRYNYSVGGTEIYINPYQPSENQKVPCGQEFCDASLGEVCFNNQVCDCPVNEGRKSKKEKCVLRQAFRLFLHVIRKNNDVFQWSPDYSNPKHPLYAAVADEFRHGIDNVYREIPALNPFYLGNEIIEIRNPKQVNGSWDRGLFFNFTVYLEGGQITNPQPIWDELYRRIVTHYNYSVGGTSLFINDFEYNPFGKNFVFYLFYLKKILIFLSFLKNNFIFRRLH